MSKIRYSTLGCTDAASVQLSLSSSLNMLSVTFKSCKQDAEDSEIFKPNNPLSTTPSQLPPYVLAIEKRFIKSPVINRKDGFPINQRRTTKAGIVNSKQIFSQRILPHFWQMNM